MSIGRTLKKLLGGLAPTIGTALGGPMGGVAMKFLADKFTGGNTGEVEDFLLSADPSQLKELKVADMEFQREMKALDIDLERINADDRASARDMAKERGTLPQVILSVVYTLGYFVVMYMFMSGHLQIDPEHKVMFGGLLGILSTAQIQIMNFWFGSSAGSKAKTQAMAKA
jgi:hypothetical protein